MAANIDMSTGKPAIAFNIRTGTPWHGLGTALEDVFNTETAIVAGGLDWTVLKERLYISEDGSAPAFGGLLNVKDVEEWFATVRSDTRAPLGIVKGRYTILQNREAFNFMDALASNGVRYDTVGALDGGRKIWLSAKLDTSVFIKGTDDRIDQYLLLSNSHDGSGTVRVLFTPTRVVCANTLAAALSGGKAQGFNVRHSGNVMEKLAIAQDVLGLAKAYYDDFADQINLMALAKPTPAQVAAYFATIYPEPKGENKSRSANIRNRLTELFEDGTGQNGLGAERSVWSAYNAVTEYLTHERVARGAGEDEKEKAIGRFEANMFGDSGNLNVLAFSGAVDLAKSLLN